MAKHRRQRFNTSDSEAHVPQVATGLSAFADILDPAPITEPQPQPVPSALHHRLSFHQLPFRCSLAWPGCRSEEAHGRHPDAHQVARDPGSDPAMLMRAAFAAAETPTFVALAGHRAADARLLAELAERTLVQSDRPRYSYRGHWSTWTRPSSLPSEVEPRALALLARDDLPQRALAALATNTHLTPEAILALCEHPRVKPIHLVTLVRRLAGPDVAGDPAERLGALADFGGPVTAMAVTLVRVRRAARPWSDQKLLRTSRSILSRFSDPDAAEEVLRGLAPTWDGTLEQLEETVAALVT